MSAFEQVAGLPIEVESYELEGHDREYSPEFTRGSTVVRLRGMGQEGIGEDVVYDVLDHIAHRDAGPGPRPQRAEDPGRALRAARRARPVRRRGARARGLAPLPPLGVRERGARPGAAPERRPAARGAGARPETRQLRLLHPPRPASGTTRRSTTEPVRKRLAKYPTLRFKLDPENDWDAELIAELAEIAGVDVLDLKGLYRGTPVDVETDPELYRAVAEAFPDAYLEDPDLNDETRPVLEPHADRITWDAPLHSLADIEALERQPKAINSKPSRFGSLSELFAVYEHCEREGIAIYGGGQGEVGPGRGQIQYLASLFHPDTPNDVAPSGYNDPAVPDGLPASPLDPAPSATGFRWGEWADR